MTPDEAAVLRKHVTRAMRSGKEHSTTSLGQVSAANVEAVLCYTGHSIEGYSRVAQSSEIRHIFRSHGDPAIEAARGQVAIRKSDFARIDEVIRRAHAIVAIGKARSAKPLRLEYLALVDGHEYRYVEELRPNRVVALKSMRKRVVEGGARRE